MKLTARYPSEVPRLKALLQKHNRSAALEVQSRSTEYATMFKLDPTVRTQVCKRACLCAQARQVPCKAALPDERFPSFAVHVVATLCRG